jgi:Post-segregation antitoxin CcdA
MTPPPNSEGHRLHTGRGKHAQKPEQQPAEQVRAEIREDLAALNAFVEAYGSFAEMVREHCATDDRDAAR